jgi:hypothetical protein
MVKNKVRKFTTAEPKINEEIVILNIDCKITDNMGALWRQINEQVGTPAGITDPGIRGSVSFFIFIKIRVLIAQIHVRS